tara:strand:- start:229 stop:717 length:489 start_codon:yes stop_codon:yes gene_type:complete
MQFKNNIKQRFGTIQGLRSLKDTLPKEIKKVINSRGQIYSEILNNWKVIAGKNLFNICYPKSYKNVNKFGESTLLIMVKRGHEVDLEYSKKEIMERINNFFGKIIIKKIKLRSFEEEQKNLNHTKTPNITVTTKKYQNKIKDVKNEKIKKSLYELTKVFKEK